MKVGDKVRVIVDGGLFSGEVGIITSEIPSDGLLGDVFNLIVKLEGWGKEYPFHTDELELVEEAK